MYKVTNAGQEVDESLEFSIDDLFRDEEESQPQEEPSNTTGSEETNKSTSAEDTDMTKRVADRIKQVRKQTQTDVEDRIAKQLGYNSYSEMLKAQEQKVIEDHGFDPKDVDQVLSALLDKRLAEDPRLKRLEEYESREKEVYIDKQLAEINKFRAANEQISSIDDLPKETIELWSKGVDLSKAYLATNGESIILSAKSKANQGSLSHLASNQSYNSPKTRGLSESEKDMWRSIVPGITEDELAKKTVTIK